MGWTIGLPCLKLSNSGRTSKHCGSFAKVAGEALEERKGQDPSIDKTKAHLNEYEGFKTFEELKQYSDNHVANLKADGFKVRSDAVRMIATVIKPPMGFFAGMTAEEQKTFLNTAVGAFKGIVGENRVKSVAYHADEQNPHVHIFWEPIRERDGMLCAKEVFNLKMLNKINKEMPQKLREKGYDIADCKMYDQSKEKEILQGLIAEFGEENGKAIYKQQKATERAKWGRSSHKYQHEAEKEVEQLQEDINKLKRAKLQLDEEVRDKSELLESLTDNISTAQATLENVYTKHENLMIALDWLNKKSDKFEKLVDQFVENYKGIIAKFTPEQIDQFLQTQNSDLNSVERLADKMQKAVDISLVTHKQKIKNSNVQTFVYKKSKGKLGCYTRKGEWAGELDEIKAKYPNAKILDPYDRLAKQR